MGAVNARPLAEIPKEDVAQHVQSLGDGYKKYAAIVDDNGIDGDLLSEMDEHIFLETLDDVDIVNDEHRSRLMEEFQIYANACIVEGQSPMPEVTIGESKQQQQQQQGAALSPMATSTPRDSSRLPQFNLQGAAPSTDQRHLGSNFYQAIDNTPGTTTRPPVGHDDMDRVAQMESYKLEEIEPDSDIARKLVGLVQMAMNLFDIDMGDITFLNHECQYSLARVGLTDPMEEAIMGNVYQVLNYDAQGKAFLCKTDRSIGICNYPTYSKRTFCVHDILLDDAFRWMRVVWPFRCYMGAPLLSASGVVIGTLCMHNLDPRPDLDRACEIQLEQVANMVVQSIENWKLRRNITVLESTRLSLQSTKNKTKPPQDGKAVVCFLGVEECATLMDVAPSQMKLGLLIYHDKVQKLRQQYFGYEVSKSGHSEFCLIFHDAVDAFGFALNLQQALFDAEWSKAFLAIPRVGDSGTGFRGLRVKMGTYMGNVKTLKANTGKTEYQNIAKGKYNTIGIAKTLYEMAYGGQILTIFDTWNVASFLAESKLESPQVVDLGEHVIRTGAKASDGILSERIVQLVPSPLAIDYGDLTKLGDSFSYNMDASLDGSMDVSVLDGLGRARDLWGRQFPVIKSEKKLSPSFFDAPGFNNVGPPAVTIAFIGTSEIEKRYKEATELVSRIIGLASSALDGTKGYQCQNNMLAFPNLTAAIDFGLDFSEMLKQQNPIEGGVNMGNLVTYGCVHDSFITLEPHKTTGRADYFGKVVNRAARVAYTSALGTVCAGVTVTPDFDQNSFSAGDPNITTRFVDRRKLKGVEGEVAVFECRRPTPPGLHRS